MEKPSKNLEVEKPYLSQNSYFPTPTIHKSYKFLLFTSDEENSKFLYIKRRKKKKKSTATSEDKEQNLKLVHHFPRVSSQSSHELNELPLQILLPNKPSNLLSLFSHYCSLLFSPMSYRMSLKRPLPCHMSLLHISISFYSFSLNHISHIQSKSAMNASLRTFSSYEAI